MHTLAQYTVDGKGAYVTSGAGAMVHTSDQNGEMMQHRLAGRSINATRTLDGVRVGHSSETVWNSKVAGFTLHTFSDDFSTLKTDYISAEVPRRAASLLPRRCLAAASLLPRCCLAAASLLPRCCLAAASLLPRSVALLLPQCTVRESSRRLSSGPPTPAGLDGPFVHGHQGQRAQPRSFAGPLAWPLATFPFGQLLLLRRRVVLGGSDVLQRLG